jgi:hypothetical protein
MTQIPDTLSGAAAALIGLVALAVVVPIAGWQFIRGWDRNTPETGREPV